MKINSYQHIGDRNNGPEAPSPPVKLPTEQQATESYKSSSGEQSVVVVGLERKRVTPNISHLRSDHTMFFFSSRPATTRVLSFIHSIGEMRFPRVDKMEEYFKSSWALDAYSYALPEPGALSLRPESVGGSVLARLLVDGLSIQIPAGGYGGGDGGHARIPLARNDGNGNPFDAYNFNLFDIIQEAQETIADIERMERDDP